MITDKEMGLLSLYRFLNKTDVERDFTLQRMEIYNKMLVHFI